MKSRLLLIFIVVLLYIPMAQADTPSDFTDYKTIVLNNATTINNTIIQINSSNFIIYDSQWDVMNHDGNDTRFFSTDELITYPLYISNIVGQTDYLIYVNVTDIGVKAIRWKYGNVTASSVSDISGVGGSLYEFSENFAVDNLDTTWLGDTGSFTISGGILNQSTGEEAWKSINHNMSQSSSYDTITIKAKLKETAAGNFHEVVVKIGDNNASALRASGNGIYFGTANYADYKWYWGKAVSGSDTALGTGLTPDHNWHDFELSYSGGTWTLKLDDVTVDTDTGVPSFNPTYIMLGGYASTADSDFWDNISVEIISGVSVNTTILVETGRWNVVAPKYGSEAYIHDLIWYNGTVYAGSDPGALLLKWNQTDDSWDLAASKPGGTSADQLHALTIFNGSLYGAYGNLGGELAVFNDSVGTMDIVATQYAGIPAVYTIRVFNNSIFGSGSAAGGGNLMRWEEGDSVWTQVAPQYNSETIGGVGLRVFENEIYGGSNINGYLLKYNQSGGVWDLILPYLPPAETIHALQVYDGNLYGGTSEPDGVSSEGQLLLANFTSGVWQSVAPLYGSEKNIDTIQLMGDELYGGTGVATGQEPAGGYLLKWNGKDEWILQAERYGIGRAVYAMLSNNGTMYGGLYDEGVLTSWQTKQLIAPGNIINNTNGAHLNLSWDWSMNGDRYEIKLNDTIVANITDLYYNYTATSYEIPTIYVRTFNSTHDSYSEWVDGGTIILTADTQFDIVVTLLSQTPSTLYSNSTGFFTQAWGISHLYPLNTTTITYTFHNIYDGGANHSLRMPSNNISIDGWRGDNRNKTCDERLSMEGNTTVFGGDISTWGGLDINSTRMTMDVVNSTYTNITIDGVSTVQGITMTNSWYINRYDMMAADKDYIDIDKTQSWLIKYFDAEITAGRDTNYTLSFWTDTRETVSAPPSPDEIVFIWWANASFDPAGGVNIKDSPYSGFVGAINYTDWLDHEYIVGNNNYIRFDAYGGLFPAINKTPEMYVYFETESPKKFKINATDIATCTNVSFAQTETMWKGSNDGTTYTAYAYTPNMWQSFHRGNQTFESMLWAGDVGGNFTNSSLEQTEIIESKFNPTAPVFSEFGFAGYLDRTMDCTYRDNLTLWVGTGTDPDGGVVTANLTLHYAANQTLVTIVNSSITDGVGFVSVNFNTTPYYSTDYMYVLKMVATDDEYHTTTRWLPVNFSLSPLGTTGILSDGPRLTFWGHDDVPALYTAVSDNTVISLSGGIYTFHKAAHHSQYEDVFNITSDIRIVSINDPSTPYYRSTGTSMFDGATMISWNETSGAPAIGDDEFRAYLYTDEYYSSVSILNSNMSYLGKGTSPYRGVYIQRVEGAVINNSIFLHNDRGISMTGGGGNYSITNCTISDSIDRPLGIYGENGNISIRDNVITVTAGVETTAFVMRNCGSGNEVINNTVTSSVAGRVQNAFYIRDTTDTIFWDNTATDTQYGLFISYNSDNITVENNNFTVHEDEYTHTSYGISTFVGTHNFSNNTIVSTGGHGIKIEEGAHNCILTNNSITTDSGFSDYVFDITSTGNIIRDPADTSNTIQLADAGSSVLIENTDSQAFSEDGSNTTYAYTNGNFSMSIKNVAERITISQRDMTILPSNDTVAIFNFEWNDIVKFNVSSNTDINPTWFNITQPTWANMSVYVYRNDTYYTEENASALGFIAHNYSESISSQLFEFRTTLFPLPVYIPLNLFMFMGLLLFVFAGASFYFTGLFSIFTSMLSVMFAFILSKIAINGTLIQNIGGFDSAGTVVQGVTTIEIPTLSYILMFIGLIMIVILAIQVMREIEFRKSRDVIELDI